MKPRPKLKHWLWETSNSTVSMKLWSQLLLSFLGATADWVLRQPPCDLTSTATGFYKRKYALAVANQSPLRDKINEALIELQFSNKFEVGVRPRTSQRGTAIPNRDCLTPFHMFNYSIAVWFNANLCHSFQSKSHETNKKCTT